MGIRERRAREDVGGLDLISESGGRLSRVLGDVVGDRCAFRKVTLYGGSDKQGLVWLKCNSYACFHKAGVEMVR